jgi:hypothetical protein
LFIDGELVIADSRVNRGVKIPGRKLYRTFSDFEMRCIKDTDAAGITAYCPD